MLECGSQRNIGLFQDAPQMFDVILMNLPFGGRETQEAQTTYAYETGQNEGNVEEAFRPSLTGG